MRKVGVLVALIGCMILCNPVRVMACDKTSGCYAKNEIVQCGTIHGEYLYTHYITEPNGYHYSCDVAKESSVHTITCSGCNAYLRSEVRTCSMKHSSCSKTEKNLCQY